jgi:hypothetical protein
MATLSETLKEYHMNQKEIEQGRLRQGDVVKHFKYETLTEKEKLMGIYTYQICFFAHHTETGELLVVYKALYTNEKWGIHFDTFVRPYDMFMGEVDHEKYPDIQQKYRFELFSEREAFHPSDNKETEQKD